MLYVSDYILILFMILRKKLIEFNLNEIHNITFNKSSYDG